ARGRGGLRVGGRRWGPPGGVAWAAARVAGRAPSPGGLDRPAADGRRHATSSDVLDRVEALEEFEHHGRTATPLGSLHRGSARFVLRARDQLLRSLRQEVHHPALSANPAAAGLPADEAVLRAVLAAFPGPPGRPRGAAG